MLYANSSVWTFPTKVAPASTSRAYATASRPATGWVANQRGWPAPVGRPATSTRSFTASRSPLSAPDTPGTDRRGSQSTNGSTTRTRRSSHPRTHPQRSCRSAGTVAATGGSVRFLILGPLKVIDGERAVPLGGGRQRTVLAVLLANAGQVVPLEHLIDTVWDEAPPATARRQIQNDISALRRALSGDRQPAGHRLRQPWVPDTAEPRRAGRPGLHGPHDRGRRPGPPERAGRGGHQAPVRAAAVAGAGAARPVRTARRGRHGTPGGAAAGRRGTLLRPGAGSRQAQRAGG